MKLLQDAIPRAEPSSYGCNVHWFMLAKLMFPHLVCDKLPVGIEVFNLGAEEAGKVNIGFARQHTDRLGIVVHANLSDEQEHAIECLAHLHANSAVGVQELVVAKQ